MKAKLRAGDRAAEEINRRRDALFEQGSPCGPRVDGLRAAALRGLGILKVGEDHRLRDGAEHGEGPEQEKRPTPPGAHKFTHTGVRLDVCIQCGLGEKEGNHR